VRKTCFFLLASSDEESDSDISDSEEDSDDEKEKGQEKDKRLLAEEKRDVRFFRILPQQKCDIPRVFLLIYYRLRCLN